MCERERQKQRLRERDKEKQKETEKEKEKENGKDKNIGERERTTNAALPYSLPPSLRMRAGTNDFAIACCVSICLLFRS